MGPDPKEGSEGEESIFGKGGKGGLYDGTWPPRKASAAKSRCAGGGGGLAARSIKEASTKAGGQGGPGYLVVFPLPDIARFARVLAMLDKLAAEQDASATGAAQVGEAADTPSESEDTESEKAEQQQ